MAACRIAALIGMKGTERSKYPQTHIKLRHIPRSTKD